jgi:DNA-binding NarL/FixJ family response regulator
VILSLHAFDLEEFVRKVLDYFALLSLRERETAILLCRGMTNEEIAGEIAISLGTAKFHVHNIMRKTGAKTRTAAVWTLAKTIPA